MQCPRCIHDIEDDSHFCDQCGFELRFCPSCGTLVKGRCCTKCGTTLPSAGSTPVSRSASVTPTPSAQVPAPAGPSGRSAAIPTVQRVPDSTSGTRRVGANESINVATPTLRLLNSTLNIDLVVRDNTTVGRILGDYVHVFGRFDQVSSRHCRFHYDPSCGWSVIDLGSTNKTCFNGVELAPNVTQQLTDHGFLKIANIEFFVRVGNT